MTSKGEAQARERQHQCDNKKSQISNCPFCKSTETKLRGYHGTLSAKSEVYIECLKCGARGPIVEFEHYKGMTIREKISAIHWWNTREV